MLLLLGLEAMKECKASVPTSFLVTLRLLLELLALCMHSTKTVMRRLLRTKQICARCSHLSTEATVAIPEFVRSEQEKIQVRHIIQ
jgi:hypothetical protein